MDDLIVKKLELGPIGTNAFLLWENKGSEAILIDAPPNCGDEIPKILKENDLTLIRDLANPWTLGPYGRSERSLVTGD